MKNPHTKEKVEKYGVGRQLPVQFQKLKVPIRPTGEKTYKFEEYDYKDYEELSYYYDSSMS